MNNKPVKNIIFDLGGVIIDLKREEAVKALNELGLADADDMLGLYGQKGIFLALEEGKATAADFFDEIRRRTSPDVTDVQIQDALNRFLIRIPVERLQMLRKLREAGYRLYVLSNTNAIMFNSWIRDAFTQEDLRVNDYFDGIVKSYDEGICKPDPEIFARVARRYNLDPAETLMLDDSAKNCAAALSVGLQAEQVTIDPSNDMLAICTRLLLTLNP